MRKCAIQADCPACSTPITSRQQAFGGYHRHCVERLLVAQTRSAR